jgi:hypothetical protein
MTTITDDEKSASRFAEEEVAFHRARGRTCYVDAAGNIRDGEKPSPFVKISFPKPVIETISPTPIGTASELSGSPAPAGSHDAVLLKSAAALYSRRWSEHPGVIAAIDQLINEVLRFRKLHGRRIKSLKQYKKHLKVMVIDLWVARKMSLNPYRAISLRKPDYRTETFYEKMFLKYDFVVGVINDMIALGYFDKRPGFRSSTVGYRTRLKATDHLIETIERAGMPTIHVRSAVKSLEHDPESGKDLRTETIILRDADKNAIAYKDTPAIVRMRGNLERINAYLAKSHITLRATDDEFKALEARLRGAGGRGRKTIDFTRESLHRVFNEDFDHGGRFYGGWWQEIPKEFRKFIEINHKHTIELDYSGHHFRILYAKEGLSPPDDPYDIAGFDRDTLKPLAVIMLNAKDQRSALKAATAKGIKKPITLAKALLSRHKPIAHHFYTGAGRTLQLLDSNIAEDVMLKMIDREAAILPVHDSFLVRAGWDVDLEEMMIEAFEKHYGKAAIKPKRTLLETKEPRSTSFMKFNEIF